MNLDRKDFVKMEPEKLRSFVAVLAQKAGMPEDKAAFLAECWSKMTFAAYLVMVPSR